ncbi:tetratricopeptide repeat protein [Streptomyces virginiae]|uniref:Helix-turn-helix domain-containing protein n=1 Tax=Streptomyces virginiae TaxID=1961 RepID=A0ABZ1TR05_STRVG|nr:tetratricopeptide repeat protein [Streptomyces virginiae]
MAETKKRGRRWAPIHPVNTHAGHLAQFLRHQVDASGKTLAVLAGEVGYSKSQVSHLLGGRIPPRHFVVALISATVPDLLRERRQADALQLLHAAEHPPRTSAPTVPAQAGAVTLAQQADQIQVYERLTRALEQEGELRQAAENSARLIWVLLGMVNRLDDRVRVLSGERDRLAGQVAGGAVEAAEKRLTRAEEQKAKAESELTRAEEKKRQADSLADRLREEIEALTDELDRLRGDGPSPHDDLPRQDVHLHEGPKGDAEADDIDTALARAAAVNDEDSDTIDRISTEITGNPTMVDMAPPIVPDNALTSPDVANRPAAQLKQEALAAAKRGDAAEAASLYGALAAVTSAYLGAEHIESLNYRHHHAYWTGEAGDSATARDLYPPLIADRTRVLGPDHRDTLASRHNHSSATGNAGDPATARDLHATLVTDYTRVLGPDHKDTLNSRHNHAFWTGDAGDPATARDLHATLVTDYTRVLGPDHEHTLISRNNHALWTGDAGDPATARDLHATLVTDRTRILGPHHEHTLTSRHNHAHWTGEAGDPTAARDLHATLVTDRTRILGPHHKDTLASRHNHARWTGEAGDPATARDLYAALVTDRTRILGPDHKDTLASRNEHTRWEGEATKRP